jgi:hypothetical protein
MHDRQNDVLKISQQNAKTKSISQNIAIFIFTFTWDVRDTKKNSPNLHNTLHTPCQGTRSHSTNQIGISHFLHYNGNNEPVNEDYLQEQRLLFV